MLKIFAHFGWFILSSGVRGRSSPRHGFLRNIFFFSDLLRCKVSNPDIGNLAMQNNTCLICKKENLQSQSLNRVPIVGFEDDVLVGVSGCRHNHYRHDHCQNCRLHSPFCVNLTNKNLLTRNNLISVHLLFVRLAD